jgi:hypothetical protein
MLPTGTGKNALEQFVKNVTINMKNFLIFTTKGDLNGKRD